MSAIYPPMDGTVLLSGLVDFNLEHNPTLSAFVYSEAPGSLSEISFLEFGRAAHRAGHFVRPNRTAPENEVVAIVANLDNLLYQTLIAGMMQAGLVPFPMSPRNSPEAVVSMLQKASCHRMLVTHASLNALVTGVSALIPADFLLSIEDVPTMAQCYPHLGHETIDHAFNPYPAPLVTQDMDDVIMYLHSSGSTGFPKPIPQTNRIVLGWCALDGIVEFRSVSRVAAMHLPPFHGLGIVTQLFVPLASVTCTVLYPPTAFADHTKGAIIPTSDNILEHCKRTDVTAGLFVPSFLEAWSSEPDSVEWLRSLQFVGYGGGPLAVKAGDALARDGVHLVGFYGATEFGLLSTVYGRVDGRSPEDWRYMRFSDNVNVRWVPQADGTCESQFLDTELHKVSVHNLPDVKGYASSDCWEPHPTKAGLWRIVGRLDDVLILASGENVVPAPLENAIMSSPLVGGAVVFGRERNQVGILLEPAPGVFRGDVADFRTGVWPCVEEANQAAPTYSRIFKEMILVTDSDKPMLRVAKGTVAKKATLKIYSQEIEALYETVEASAQATTNIDLPKTWDEHDDVETWLAAQAADIHSGHKVDLEADLFEQGFDSLSATFLRNRIMGTLRSSSDHRASKAVVGITQNVVFAHPSIKQLASHIVNLVSHEGAVGTASAASAIEDMIEKYSTGLREVHASPGSAPVDAVVLLTGSTGNLGSFLLESLLKDARVETVYAYNRPAKGTATIQDRQKDAFDDKGFDVELLHSAKLVYVEGDSALPKIGLADNLYEKIRASVNIIIHNAWRLDFNLSLASFESNIRGTRNFIDLASHCEHADTVRFMFTSSIGSSQGWDKAKGAFPEAVQTDVSVAVGGGYGEAKYVAERILAKSGLQASSFRIGQITGGRPNGAWATSDWVPSLVKSSLALGALPDAQGVASWLPAHAVSAAILDVAFAQAPPSLALNVVHPRPHPWSAVIQSISDALCQAGATPDALPLVPFGEWLGRLEQRCAGADAREMARIPAIKLLGFFRGMAAADAAARRAGRADAESGSMPSLSTTKAQAASRAIRELEPLGADDAQRWVRYWISKKFFEDSR